MRKIAYVGIDYHVNLLSIAVMLKGKEDPYVIRLENDDKVIRNI